MRHKVYLIPGLGADKRLYHYQYNLEFDFEVIEWEDPLPSETFSAYIKRFSRHIDKDHTFDLLGVSLGGIVAVELSTFLNPRKVILISSLKSNSELPALYKISRYIKIHKVIPWGFLKRNPSLVRPFFGKMNKEQKEMFNGMLKDTSTPFIAWALDCVFNWKREAVDREIIRFHGDNDYIFPVKNIKDAIIIKGGGHYMIQAYADEINSYLKEILK
jgi:pimeloyl-ACP methyl ester carboxylesterase